MTGKAPKSADESAIVTRYILMPRDANPRGTAFGGLIMSWIDAAASMAAVRHCESEVVTAAIDSLAFRAPIRVGDHVVLNARVTYTGRSSLEVSVIVMRENPILKTSEIATTAYLTFVSLDDQGVPKEVPPLACDSAEECAGLEKARERVRSRKEHRSRHDEFL
jgi:acyl-CoA hydrolase